MYLLPKIYKRLHKSLIWSAKSWSKSDDFLNKLKSPGEVLTDNAISITADIVGLYPNISHKDELNTLSAILEEHQGMRPKKKNGFFPSEHPGEIFFPKMQLVNFFRNKWIKKILNRRRKLKKRKKNEISWKRKMLGHSSLLTFFIYIYKSQIHMFQLM